MESNEEVKRAFTVVKEAYPQLKVSETEIGSTIFAVKPGDGSAREQAASCQRVLGGLANIANEYATKRYRSNLINWGLIPFIIDEGELPFRNGDFIFIPGAATAGGSFSAVVGMTGCIHGLTFVIWVQMVFPANLSCCLRKRRTIMNVLSSLSIFPNSFAVKSRSILIN